MPVYIMTLGRRSFASGHKREKKLSSINKKRFFNGGFALEKLPLSRPIAYIAPGLPLKKFAFLINAAFLRDQNLNYFARNTSFMGFCSTLRALSQ